MTYYNRSQLNEQVGGIYMYMSTNYSLASSNGTAGANETARQPTMLDKLTADMVYILVPFIVILGTIGNILAMCVIIRRGMRIKSVYYYLTILACADTTVLFTGPLRGWVARMTHFELMHTNGFMCKAVIFLIVFSQHLSAWLIVLVTTDRFLSIWYPFQAATFCTVKRARVITAALVAVLVAYNTHIFWTFELISSDDRLQCTIDNDNPFHYIYDYIKAVTYCLFPSLIVLVLNSCIIYKVIQRKHLMSGPISGQSREAQPRRVSRRKGKVTPMLIVISSVWLGLTTPYGIFSVARTQISGLMNESLYRFSITVCFLLFYLNHSVNFYLYCLTGQKIRTEFINMILNACRCSRRPQRARKGTKKTRRTQKTPVLYNEVELRVITL